jgi:DNA-binding winged helix-turn-helix (wHTH) protein
MSDTPNPGRIYRFGLYSFDSRTGELSKDGKMRPRVQGQPLEILTQLLKRPGEVVTREEIRQRLWPADTFVDYDHSLNTAVNKLRDALNDAAENPRFIQTIPRRGYRFIASVEVIEGKLGEKTSATLATAEDISGPPLEIGEQRTRLLSDPQDLPSASRGVVGVLFALIQVMYLSFYVAALAGLREMESVLEQALQYPKWLFVAVLVTAMLGIPIRLYFLAAAAFGYRGLARRFLSLFPLLFALDELWALSPFLIVEQIGIGLALASTAALLYVPFAERSLLLMREKTTE